MPSIFNFKPKKQSTEREERLSKRTRFSECNDPNENMPEDSSEESDDTSQEFVREHDGMFMGQEVTVVADEMPSADSEKSSTDLKKQFTDASVNCIIVDKPKRPFTFTLDVFKNKPSAIKYYTGFNSWQQCDI